LVLAKDKVTQCHCSTVDDTWLIKAHNNKLS